MTQRQGPLAGVRVIEFAGLGPAPFACMMLADMGADVVRIARPGQAPPFGMAQKYNLYDRSRAGFVSLDLRNADDHEQALALCGQAEIVVEGFRPGVMERLGLGPETLLAHNPALVFGRMTGWGQDGPLKDRAGHDLNYMAISGALWAIGPEEAPPPPPQNIVADLAGGGMMMVAGVLAALTHARTSGNGQVVDACMSDGAALMMVMQYGLKAAGIGHDGARGADILNGGSAWYQCYRTKDDFHVSIAAIEPQFFAHLLSAIGREGDPVFARQYDPDAQAAMQGALTEIFLEKTRAEWVTILSGIDACFAPVLSMEEAPAHAHNKARGTFVQTGDILQPGPCPRFLGTPADPPTDGTAAPLDAADVLRAWS